MAVMEIASSPVPNDNSVFSIIEDDISESAVLLGSSLAPDEHPASKTAKIAFIFIVCCHFCTLFLNLCIYYKTISLICHHLLG